MDYGIANASGQPGHGDAVKIVETAWRGGVHEFDTAQAYGDSERVLGEAFQSLGIADKVRVLSKVGSFNNPAELVCAVRRSLDRLQVPALHGLMLHREADLCSLEGETGETLKELERDGVIGSAGISVYSPEAALKALEIDCVDAVQIPGNLLDRRFANAGVHELAASLGKTIYVRSIFLQGLLLMDPERVFGLVAEAAPYVAEVRQMSARYGLDPLALCWAYAVFAYPQARILFGAETVLQVKENLEAVKGMYPSDMLEEVRCVFDNVPEGIVNPSLWENV